MTENEIQAEVNGLKNLLAQTDYKALKHAEGGYDGEEWEAARAQRQSWRDRINELEAVEPEEEAEPAGAED